MYLGITKLIYYSILNDRIFFILITFSNNDNERKRNISQIPIDLTVLKPPSFYDFVLNIHILMKHQKSHHFISLNQKKITLQAYLQRCSSNPFKFWRRTLLKRTLIKGVHLQVTSGCL